MPARSGSYGTIGFRALFFRHVGLGLVLIQSHRANLLFRHSAILSYASFGAMPVPMHSRNSGFIPMQHFETNRTVHVSFFMLQPHVPEPCPKMSQKSRFLGPKRDIGFFRSA
jgi:hypothetical protein